MWFERKKAHVPEETPDLEHWSGERMILEGHANFATPEDLAELPDGMLVEIAQICQATQYAPDECIPCLAHVMFLERQQSRLEEMTPKEFDQEFDEGEEVELDGEAQIIPELYERAKKVLEEDRLLDPATIEENWEYPEHAKDARHADPHREIQRTLRYLDGLLDEALNGPPIPPRDVSQYELALLVLAADKWVKMTAAQGLDMGVPQRKVFDDTQALVAKLQA